MRNDYDELLAKKIKFRNQYHNLENEVEDLKKKLENIKTYAGIHKEQQRDEKYKQHSL